jgi:hypothetical protein
MTRPPETRSVIPCADCGPYGVVAVSLMHREILICSGCGKSWAFERSP